MTTNPLRLLIVPAITIIFYLVASYIALIIIAYAYDLGRLDILISYTPASVMAPIIIFESLPIFLVSLLFTMQYSMTSVNLKNIGYACSVAITMAVVKSLLTIFFFYIVFFIGDNRDYQFFMNFVISPLFILFIALLFIAIALVSDYYFRWTKQEVNPLEFNGGALITSISYVLLVLCPPAVTGVLFALSFNAQNPYAFPMYGSFASSLSSIALIYVVGFIYSLILVLFWTYDIIKKYFALNTYATSTVKAYIFTQFSYILLYVLLTCIALFLNNIDLRDIIDSVGPECLIVILMVASAVLLLLLARIVKGLAYKIYHVTTCILFIGWLYSILPSYRDSMVATVGPTVIVLFVTCVSLYLFARCIRGSLNIVFK